MSPRTTQQELWGCHDFFSAALKRTALVGDYTAGDDPDRHSIGWEKHEYAAKDTRWRNYRPLLVCEDIWCALKIATYSTKKSGIKQIHPGRYD